MEGHVAPISRKEGLVSSPTEAQGTEQEPDARTWGPQQDVERHLYFYLGELLGQVDQGLMKSNCQGGGPGPEQKQSREGSRASVLLPPCTVRLSLPGEAVASPTVGLRHKSPRGMWPQPS